MAYYSDIQPYNGVLIGDSVKYFYERVPAEKKGSLSVLPVSEWCKAILEYFVAEANGIFRVSPKFKIMRQFGENVDENTEVAFLSLLRDELIIPIETSETTTFYSINFEKKDEIKAILFGAAQKVQLGINQPHASEWEGLKLEFETESNRALPNHGKYYHCTKETDGDFWITLVKTKKLGKADKLILGSLKDTASRLCRIWAAVQKAEAENKNGTFIKQRIEELEPKACGNTRQYAKAAFEIFEFLGLIQMISSKGRSGIYTKTGTQIPLITLDQIFQPLLEEEHKKSQPDTGNSVMVKEIKPT